MSWSQRAVDAAVLAATVLEDREASRAALAPSVEAAVTSRAAELTGLDSARRRRALQELAATLRPTPAPGAELSPRARAVLATRMPRAEGARWMQQAPRPRAGWAAPAGLRATLGRVAQAPDGADQDAADRERGLGRELLARHTRALEGDERGALLEAAGADEAAAVVALGELLEAEPDPAADANVRLEAARRMAAADADRTRAPLTRVLGAVQLGWDAGEGGDETSRAWRRAGRELRELWEAGCLA